MSRPEFAYRMTELSRRAADSLRQWCWEDFGGFDGPVLGLRGAVPSRIGSLMPLVQMGATRIAERRFVLLGSTWPETPDWDALWQLDPVTGKRWPGAQKFAFRCNYRHERKKGDVKYVWELNRLQFLPVAALAGRNDLVAEILRSWMKMNPPFRGINWTSGIEAATRVMSLLAAYGFLSDHSQRELDRDARSFLDAHLFWIDRYPSLFSSANNHRVAELVAQFVAATCLPGLRNAEALRASAQDDLEGRMDALFHADGVGAEQSVLYAAYALEWFALAGIAADASACGFSEAFTSRAARAADHLLWLMDDDAHTPAIGDGDESRVLALTEAPEDRYAASIVLLIARWLNAPELVPPRADSALRDIWGAHEIAAAASQRAGMRVFDAGGYTVWRKPTPQGTLVLVFDHGPLGFESIAAHGHADALSVWLSWGDEQLIVDAGTYLYHSGRKWRDYFRGTVAHNTLSIDQANQSRIAGPFNWSRHALASIVERSEYSITAEHDGFVRRHDVRHRRTVSVDESGSVLIDDSLAGRRVSSDIKWSIRFMLAPDVRLKQEDAVTTLITPRGRTLRIALDDGPPMLSVLRLFQSRVFGYKSETSALTASGTLAGNPRRIARVRLEPMIDG
ncbi:MAG: alginate lyase family protein [Rhizomicrobium sp.]